MRHNIVLTASAILISILSTLSTSCIAHKERATGVQNRIIVFSSPEDLPLIQSSLESVFGRVVYTPEPEPYFELDYADPSRFDGLKFSHNIIVASIFSPGDSTGDLLAQSLLPGHQFELALRGENHVFSTRDFYARGQVLAILAANTEQDLARSLQEKGRWLFDRFDHALLERLKHHVFKSMERKKLGKQFQEKYGWFIRLQHDWEVIEENPDKNFVWLGRSFPYRWLCIHWVDNPPVKKLDPQIVAELVRNLPTVFSGSIRFTQYYQQMEQIQLNRWPAWRVEGLWEHRTDAKGGPFVSYLFYDDLTDRLFHINCLIHYPGGKKVMLLRQMEIMVNTFSIGSRDPARKTAGLK